MAKSTYSGADSCVDVEFSTDIPVVTVRNTVRPKWQTLVFTHDEWRAFILGVKAGEFDVPGDAPATPRSCLHAFPAHDWRDGAKCLGCGKTTMEIYHATAGDAP